MQWNTLSEQLPLNILEKAVKLRNCTKKVFLSLYSLHKPATCIEIAEKVGHARAYTNMRLNTLEDLGLVKRTRQGKKNYFEVTP